MERKNEFMNNFTKILILHVNKNGSNPKNASQEWCAEFIC